MFVSSPPKNERGDTVKVNIYMYTYIFIGLIQKKLIYTYVYIYVHLYTYIYIHLYIHIYVKLLLHGNKKSHIRCALKSFFTNVVV